MKKPFLPSLLRTAALATVCASLTATVVAQAPAPAAPTAPTAPGATAPVKPLSPTEKTFVRTSAKSIYFQIQLANAAKSTLTDPKDTRLRDTTIKDLNKAFEALAQIGKAHGETLPTELGGADKSTVERLGKMKDDKFAKEWTDELLKESKRLDRDFEAAAKTIQDVELKTYVANYTPIMHNVFTSAEAAEKAAKAPKKKK